MSEPCPLNDLSTEESPLHSHQPLEGASVVKDTNVFLDSDVDEEDKSANNKVKEAAGIHVYVVTSTCALYVSRDIL